MILSNLAAGALLISIATGPLVDAPIERLSLQQRDAATRAYTRLATDCIVRIVGGDPRFQAAHPETKLGDLIVDAVPQCLGPVRSMIDAYDRYFGDGMGEKFFMGAYLDVLPNLVINSVQKAAEAGASRELASPAKKHETPGYTP